MHADRQRSGEPLAALTGNWFDAAAARFGTWQIHRPADSDSSVSRYDQILMLFILWSGMAVLSALTWMQSLDNVDDIPIFFELLGIYSFSEVHLILVCPEFWSAPPFPCVPVYTFPGMTDGAILAGMMACLLLMVMVHWRFRLSRPFHTTAVTVFALGIAHYGFYHFFLHSDRAPDIMSAEFDTYMFQQDAVLLSLPLAMFFAAAELSRPWLRRLSPSAVLNQHAYAVFSITLLLFMLVQWRHLMHWL